MTWIRVCVALLGTAACVPSLASHLVTGNGFGFVVVAPESGTLTKFYAHPYSFVAPDPKNPLSEGIETANFIASLGWGNSAGGEASADYVQDSHVIRIRTATGEGTVFMPFGIRRPALILNWQPAHTRSSGRDSWQVKWTHSLLSNTPIGGPGGSAELLRFAGVEETLLLIPFESATSDRQPDTPLSGSDSWALVSLEASDNPQIAIREFEDWRSGVTAEGLARREVDELERWRVRPHVYFASENERHLWRQSEVMLRIAQSREMNRPGRYSNGLIVASLPDGVWFTPWVRDMAWAAVALARMGHREEARAALLAYFNARPTGKMRAETAGVDYQISVVRYFGNGAEEPFFTQEGSTNIEFDDWGEALWVLGEYLNRFSDPDLLHTATYRGTVYDTARDFIVKPLTANTEKYGPGRIVGADTSIWEERQKDKKHFAFSTAAAILGLREFAEIAQRAGDESTRTEVLKDLDRLQKGFDAAFIRRGELHGTLEEGVKNDMDGALLQIINFGVVKDPAVVRNTVDRMKLLKVASGGYRRVRGTYTDPAIYEYWYEQEEFLFVDFNLAEVDRHLGRTAEANWLLERIVNKSAADHNIIPEMYVAVPCKLFPGKIGDPTGALPMVGYGAGEYILQILERDNWRKSN